MLTVICQERWFDNTERKTYFEGETYKLTDEQVKRFTANTALKRFVKDDGSPALVIPDVKPEALKPAGEIPDPRAIVAELLEGAKKQAGEIVEQLLVAAKSEAATIIADAQAKASKIVEEALEAAEPPKPAEEVVSPSGA